MKKYINAYSNGSYNGFRWNLPGCSDTSDASGANPASVPVKVIKLGQFTDPGLSGKIIPDQDIKIVSKVSGKVAGVNVQEGDKVKKKATCWSNWKRTTCFSK